MANIVNIFGKLYTFLRRPDVVENETNSQVNNKEGENEADPGASEVSQNTKDITGDGVPQSSTENVPCEQPTVDKQETEIPDNGAGDSEGVCKEKITPTEECQVVCKVEITPPSPTCLNMSTTSGTDVDAALVGKVDGVTDPEPTHNAELLQSAEDIAEGNVNNNAEEHEAITEDKQKGEKEHSKGEKGEKKICHFYSRGLNCRKGKKCKFAHIRERDKPETSGKDEIKETPIKEVEKKVIHEKDYESYMEFVLANTLHCRQINAKDLFYKLGYEKGIALERIGEAVIGQYNLATSRNNWGWVKEARYFAELFFAPDWIDQNLPHKDFKSNRKNRPNKRKNKQNVNEHFENPRGMCQDYRLQENPNLETITANAAGDGDKIDDVSKKANGHGDNMDEFVSDYTDKVIQDAMKVAIGDGLSESVIMEVIDDVTALSVLENTPRKQSKLVKVDVTRSPRPRPEQLAVGFSYHSDVIIKESPKTINGEIIPLDLLPPPRERQDQLAMGFSFLAEQLVKDAPKTETGEVIIPGVITSPRRLPRDQLALGFSYHSDLIAKESPSDDTVTNGNANPEEIHKTNTLTNGIGHGDEIDSTNINASEIDKCEESLTKSSKRCISDMFAVGFSYNSDQIMKQSLDDAVNGNHSDDLVSSLIEDAALDEGRNVVECVEEFPVGLPAGSVW